MWHKRRLTEALTRYNAALATLKDAIAALPEPSPSPCQCAGADPLLDPTTPQGLLALEILTAVSRYTRETTTTPQAPDTSPIEASPDSDDDEAHATVRAMRHYAGVGYLEVRHALDQQRTPRPYLNGKGGV